MNSLWIEFVNSDWHDHLGGPSEDRLDNPEWLGEFLRAHALEGVDARKREVVDSLHELRGLLQRFIAHVIEKEAIPSADVAALNAYLGARPVVSVLRREDGAKYRMHLEPTQGGLEAAMFAIAVSFAEFLVEGDPSRLKRCRNPDCQWLFYDRTRSRTRCWCDETCGNLIKVRRHRRRSGKSEGS